jgi:hypothetical protein
MAKRMIRMTMIEGRIRAKIRERLEAWIRVTAGL